MDAPYDFPSASKVNDIYTKAWKKTPVGSQPPFDRSWGKMQGGMAGFMQFVCQPLMILLGEMAPPLLGHGLLQVAVLVRRVCVLAWGLRRVLNPKKSKIN